MGGGWETTRDTTPLTPEPAQIYDIFQMLPPKLQVGVFSATMPPEARSGL